MLAKMSRKPIIPTAKVQYVVGVCRKSQDREDRQIHSLDDQEKMVKEWYSDLPEEIRRKHPLHTIRTARSAFHPDQPYLLELCEMADRGEVYCVVAVFENRISRNHEDTGRFIQRLSDGRIPFFETTSGKHYKGDDSGTIFMLCIEGASSWKDSKDKGTIVLQRMEMRAQEGKHMGRKSFGFKPNTHFSQDGREIRETLADEERLAHAITMYKMAATGIYSLTDLDVWADKQGIRARPALNNPTGKLKRSAIAHILHDPYYKGEVWFNGKKAGKWTDNPPVPETLWNKVQIVMSGRNRNTARTKNQQLRRLFMCGNVMKCGKCGGQLSPYRIVKKKTGKMYVYYECKSGKGCKTLVEQSKLLAQHKAMQDAVLAGELELDAARDDLLKLHKQKAKEETLQRDKLEARYKKLQEEITDLLMQMKKAEALGVAGEIDAQIKKLVVERDALNAQLNRTHEESTAWIEKALKCFELLRSAQEMLLHGSPQIREGVLKAIASNYSVTDGKLVPDLRSPFREVLQKGERLEWWAILDSNQ